MPQQMLFFEDDLDGWCIEKYFNNQYGISLKFCFIYMDDKFLLFCNVPYSIAEFVVGCNDASGYFSSGNTATLKYFRVAVLPDEKYPDASLHPTTNSAMLYGTLQKSKNLLSI